MMKEKTNPVTLNMSDELKEKALQRAKMESRSLSNYIRWLIKSDIEMMAPVQVHFADMTKVDYDD